MAKQTLDILALEPYYGGLRRESLDALAAESRHRWVVLTLPPRQPSRRLAVSGVWFSEKLALHPPRVTGTQDKPGRVERVRFDAVVAGDLLNLHDLRRRWPRLAETPTAVRYHEPPPDESRARAIRMNTLRLAGQIWCYTSDMKAHILREAEDATHIDGGFGGGGAALADILRVVPPAIPDPPTLGRKPQRSRRSIVIDATRPLSDAVLGTLRRLSTRGEKLDVTMIGHADDLPEKLAVTIIPEGERVRITQALRSARSFIGAWHEEAVDPLTIRALREKCWTLLPDTPGNRAILAPFYHSAWLHDGEAHRIHTWLLTALHQGHTLGAETQQEALLEAFDPKHAAEVADEALAGLVEQAPSKPKQPSVGAT